MGGVVTGGGSLILASLIDRAGGALYQDFRSEYGLNLRECVGGDLPPSEIIVLIQGLGLGSRFVSELQGGEQFVGWDMELYQLATLIDAVNYNTYAVIAANSKRKPKEPKPVYRPKKEGNRQSNNMFRTQLEMAKQRKLKGG